MSKQTSIICYGLNRELPVAEQNMKLYSHQNPLSDENKGQQSPVI